MTVIQAVICGASLPFLGTALGAAAVFFMKRGFNKPLEKALLGFAAGVMLAASVWSLLIPAIDMAVQSGQSAALTAVSGFLCGVLFLFLLDLFSPHGPEALSAFKLRRMVLAVTLHNIPEGMAVGVVLAGLLSGSPFISVSAALALSFGIAVQNYPEGAIISVPLAASGQPRRKAFVIGLLSGVVEPIATILTLLLTPFIAPILPFILAFAAGAMVCVVTSDLIPASQADGGFTGTACVALGFALMMLLDVAL